MPSADARTVAGLMADADLQGSDGHGVIRLPQYLKRIRSGGGTVTNGATRSSRFWFAHALAADPTCATLSNAIAKIINVNCSVVPLGFLDLPQGFRNSDNVKDSADATIEALGLYWRSIKRTGEIGGTQNQKLPASSVCSDRKQLAAIGLNQVEKDLLR